MISESRKESGELCQVSGISMVIWDVRLILREIGPTA